MKIKETAVGHDHSEQGGWGLEWIMPAAIQNEGVGCQGGDVRH
jgi:hypothetical protein